MAIAAIGFDPLRVTLISVALTVVIMPLVVLPFLVLMNDEEYVRPAHQRPVRQRPARRAHDSRRAHGARRHPAGDLRRLMWTSCGMCSTRSVVDRNGREMGRVDGILLDTRGRPLRLSAIVIGPAALGDRLHPAVGRS